jgi:hypothetical protein
MRSALIALAVTMVVAGCGGSVPAPSERLAQAESASRGARELGAESEPTAALHLKMASDQIKQAKDLMERGDNTRAEALLVRAQADGELAVQIAKAKRTRSEADEILAKVKSMRGGK